MPLRGQNSSWHILYIFMKKFVFPRMLNRGQKEECQIYSAQKTQFQLWCQSMGWSVNNVHSTWSKYLSHVNGRFLQWSEIAFGRVWQLTFADNIIYSGHISCIQYRSVRKYAYYAIFHSYYSLFPFSFFYFSPCLRASRLSFLLPFLPYNNALSVLSAGFSLVSSPFQGEVVKELMLPFKCRFWVLTWHAVDSRERQTFIFQKPRTHV